MTKIKELTEDEVRDSAKITLGFDAQEDNVRQGTGQITTFNQLGFTGNNNKPDGWYLPENAGKVAIILETKRSGEDLSKQKHVNELFKNIDVISSKYSKTVGILYNGESIRVFKNKTELLPPEVSAELQHKEYYIKLFTEEKLDTQYIYNVTKAINETLHFQFGMQDLQERMIFTACALVAQRYNPTNGLQTVKNQGYDVFHTWVKR